MFFLNNETNRGGVIEKELKQFLEVVFIFFFFSIKLNSFLTRKFMKKVP